MTEAALNFNNSANAEYIQIGQRTIHRDAIAEIDHSFRLSMSQGGGQCSLVVLRTTDTEATVPEGYSPFVYVTDEQGRRNLQNFCTSMAQAGDLLLISQPTGTGAGQWGNQLTRAASAGSGNSANAMAATAGGAGGGTGTTTQQKKK